jgi:replicative superfamily II helicase
MVDFKKLREEKKQPRVIHPIEIFRRLPKPLGINDLYTSQAEVLDEWFSRRNEKDLVIKLHTGGGKTLVGLLIAESVLRENQEPVLYLCSTRQLVEQTLAMSHQYGISGVLYETGGNPLPEDFLAARKVLIGTYQALFNGRSKFGVLGTGKEIINLGAVILDDAHVSYSRVREAFTLYVNKNQYPEKYNHLVSIFRNDFEKAGKIGTFTDTITSREKYSVLEIPYWSWKSQLQQVYEYLRKNADEDFTFVWPFIRDSYEYSHALISSDNFVITPYFPLVDLLPSISNCPRRVYMSATIADDSTIIRTFDANRQSVEKPITSKSLAGVSERMILIPEWMKFNADYREIIQAYLKWASEKLDASIVVLTPSRYIASLWSEIGNVAEASNEVANYVQSLKQGRSKGPFIFANRYDGIDLPGDACRLLVFANMPRGINEYENYLANLFEGSVLNNSLAQRIEQGIGRGARGSGDYCVVLLYGKDLLSWIARPANARFLTRITRAQLEIGKNISDTITSPKEFGTTVRKCLDRDEDWIKYHAETLAELSEADPIQIDELTHADLERTVLRLWRDGQSQKAIKKIIKYCETTESMDIETKGWLYQFAARIAFFAGQEELSERLQHNAFSCSRNLFRPQIKPQYEKMSSPGNQANSIIQRLIAYQFRKGYLAKFEEAVAFLVPEATSNQFEQAMADLGSFLGFESERPDRAYGIGPDILWLVDDQHGLVMEAKSMKNKKNPLTKDQHGQLLNAEEWFKREYPNHTSVRISIHPNRKITDKTIPGETKVLTFEDLNQLITNARAVIQELCDSLQSEKQLLNICQQLLERNSLRSQDIIDNYLRDFE